MIEFLAKEFLSNWQYLKYRPKYQFTTNLYQIGSILHIRLNTNLLPISTKLVVNGALVCYFLPI